MIGGPGDLAGALLARGQSLLLDSLPNSGEPYHSLSLWAKQTAREQLKGTSYGLPPSREPRSLGLPSPGKDMVVCLSQGKRQEEGS